MKFLFILSSRFFFRVAAFATVTAFSSIAVLSQSNDLRFPTPVRSNEIVGTIKARDVGDSRLTTHYYTFEGEQGDLFVNVQSRNFTGDIDVYILAGQRPLTKIVTYADVAEIETGRVIYLRKPERLLLRIEGRSPGDDDASIRIKFAGSFAASRLEESTEPAMPKGTAENDSGVRVNSVGTIVAVIPKATPLPEATAEKAGVEVVDSSGDPATDTEKKAAAQETEKTTETESKPEVVVTDNAELKKPEPATKTSTANRRNRRTRNTRPPVEKPAEPSDATVPPVGETESVSTATAPKRERTAAKKPPVKKEPKPDPMAGINLVIAFKDGSTIERPMNEVMKFSVERAVLTVISKNGSIGRYPMADVSSVSIR